MGFAWSSSKWNFSETIFELCGRLIAQNGSILRQSSQLTDGISDRQPEPVIEVETDRRLDVIGVEARIDASNLPVTAVAANQAGFESAADASGESEVGCLPEHRCQESRAAADHPGVSTAHFVVSKADF